MEELTRLGRMRPAGLAAFEKRSEAKTAIWRVVSAKKEETRKKRLEMLIQDSADGRRG